MDKQLIINVLLVLIIFLFIVEIKRENFRFQEQVEAVSEPVQSIATPASAPSMIAPSAPATMPAMMPSAPASMPAMIALRAPSGDMPSAPAAAPQIQNVDEVTGALAQKPMLGGARPPPQPTGPTVETKKQELKNLIQQAGSALENLKQVVSQSIMNADNFNADNARANANNATSIYQTINGHLNQGMVVLDEGKDIAIAAGKPMYITDLENLISDLKQVAQQAKQLNDQAQQNATKAASKPAIDTTNQMLKDLIQRQAAAIGVNVNNPNFQSSLANITSTLAHKKGGIIDALGPLGLDPTTKKVAETALNHLSRGEYGKAQDIIRQGTSSVISSAGGSISSNFSKGGGGVTGLVTDFGQAIVGKGWLW
jgi:hypothetical protein